MSWLDDRSRSLSGLVSAHSFDRGLRLVLLLNLADAFFTIGWIEAGLATEANPVMAGALDLGPAAFVLAKVALVTLAVGMLWRNRELIFVRRALVPIGVLYAFVVGGHVGFAIWRGVAVVPAVLALG